MGLGTQDTIETNIDLQERIKIVLRKEFKLTKEDKINLVAGKIMAQIPENPQEREIALAMFMSPVKVYSANEGLNALEGKQVKILGE